MKIWRELLKKTSILMQHHLNLFKANSTQDGFYNMKNRKMSEQPVKSLSKAYSESLIQNLNRTRNYKLQKSTSQANLSQSKLKSFINLDGSFRIRESSIDSNSVEKMHTFNIKSSNINSKVLSTLKHITTRNPTCGLNKSSSVVSHLSNTSRCYYLEENTGLLEK